MTHFRSPLWVSLVVLVLGFAAWIGNNSKPVQTQQEADRTLELERYPDEPLQLVNLRIGTQSVKDRIKPKFKDNASKWGTDSVKFKEKDDWFKRVSITLRNTSDKAVYGLEGFLFFKPAGYSMLFSLPLTGSKELNQNPLQPGDEIELSVNQGLVNHTMEHVKNRGANLSSAVVSFSLDTVLFSDELQWYRGKLLRRDSATPGKWVPLDEPLAMKRNKPSEPIVVPAPASLTSFAHAKPAFFATCKPLAGFQGFSCAGENPDCIRRVDLADPNPGLLTHVPVEGTCIWIGHGPSSCSASTTHTRLQTDPGCQVCPDADGDGFQSASCGGSDCDDTNNAIKPGATENCSDGVDNNCSGAADSQDPCECPTFEQDIWQASGWDCSLCEDGIDNDCNGEVDYADSGCNPNQCASPVLIDVSGNGFDLTSLANGVNFDLNSDGAREKLSWTAAQTDDAWLALDRNGDGVINNGTELFGNFTPQPNPPAGYGRNGFNALVDYDSVAKGGNGDGLITDRDAVFGTLLLWQDRNHNGVSEPTELRTLKQLGLTVIECDYKESKRRDQHGNQFRYRAKVRDTRNTQVGRWAWDVFLVNEQNFVGRYLLNLVDQPTTGSVVGWLESRGE